ncbi:SpoIID/LytB domain-containing protein [Priestia megaterium]|uniref:SpoIID/LytB domain-containing protein n=1 Tax=Priestia megaterium TaxID=1404 RepID=UPI0030083F7E
MQKLFQITCIAAIFYGLVGSPAYSELNTDNAPVSQENTREQDLTKKQEMKLLEEFLVEARKTQLKLWGEQNTLSNKVVDIKPLPINFVRTVSTITPYEESGKPFTFRYAAVEYKMKKENQYALNGINYRLVIYVKDNGKWHVAHAYNIPVDQVVDANVGFGTEDEKQMAEIFRKRLEGIYVNREGKVIGLVNTASADDLKAEMTGPKPANMQPSKWTDFVPDQVNKYYPRPKFINVLMTTEENKKHYGCKEDCLIPVDFLDYLKHVFPYEWSADMPPESLKAGALALKMKSWYAVVVNPLAGRPNTHVLDVQDPQVYHANYQPKNEEEKARIEELQNIFHAQGVAGIGFKDGLSENLFLSEYDRNTDKNTATGKLSINGSKELAKEGKNAAEIIQHYYMGSDKMEQGASVTFFRYAK